MDRPHLLRDDDVIGLGERKPLLRFSDPTDNPTPLATPGFEPVKGLRLVEKTMTFFLDEKQLVLTRKEFNLLYHLYQHIGQLCTRESCAQVMWGEQYADITHLADWNEALNRKITDLRQKLRSNRKGAEDMDMIETLPTKGYLLKPEQ